MLDVGCLSEMLKAMRSGLRAHDLERLVPGGGSMSGGGVGGNRPAVDPPRRSSPVKAVQRRLVEIADVVGVTRRVLDPPGAV